jgi:uncharacterized protein (DUF2342 family)
VAAGAAAVAAGAAAVAAVAAGAAAVAAGGKTLPSTFLFFTTTAQVTSNTTFISADPYR